MPAPLPAPRLLMLGLLLLGSAGCAFVSTGARSAMVVLVREEVTTPQSPALPMPPREELKAALAKRFLWLADDTRGAQWIAYVSVHTPPTPLQPFGLSVVEVKKNPKWQPWAVSDPLATRDSGTASSFRLQEQNEQHERSLGRSTR